MRDGREVIEYQLQTGELMDGVVLKNCKENMISSVLPTGALFEGGHNYIFAFTDQKVSVKKKFSEGISAELVLKTFDSMIATVQSYQKSSINLAYILFDPDYIFWNNRTNSVEFACFPIKNTAYDPAALMNSFRELLAYAVYDGNENGDYVAKLLSAINSGSDIEGLSETIQVIMNAYGIASPQKKVAEPEPQPAPEVVPQAAAAPAPEVVPQAAVEPVAVPEPVAEPQPAPEVVPQAVVEPVAASEPVAEAQPTPEVVPQAVVEPVAAPEPVAEPQPAPEVVPQVAVEPQPVPAPQPVPEVVPQAAVEPQPVPAPQPVPEPVAEPQPAPQPAPEPSAAPQPYLIRTKTGEKITLPESEFIIGKSANNANYVVADNSAVSRVHCTIYKNKGAYFVRDERSTNSTFVNGEQVLPGMDHVLINNCKLVLGDEEFTYHLW